MTTNDSIPGSRLVVRKFLSIRTASHGPEIASSSISSAGTTTPSLVTTP